MHKMSWREKGRDNDREEDEGEAEEEGEEKRHKKLSKPNSSLHLDTFRQLAGVGKPAAHVLKSAPDEGDYLLGDSILSQ